MLIEIFLPRIDYSYLSEDFMTLILMGKKGKRYAGDTYNYYEQIV